jgi:DNA-binding helix-hairpin-helix protein with protein kinase domain
MSKDFKMLRTQNHDSFGLAILIFLLLFMGRHPFSGVYKGKDDMPIERAIAENRFAFGRNAPQKAIAPPPNAVGLSVVPSDVSGLFEQSFADPKIQDHGRPTANDWWNVLDTLEKRLKKCPNESMHIYYTGLTACPWCNLENSSGVLLFLSSDAISRIDLAAEWQKVLAIKPPGPVPEISPQKYHCIPSPLSPEISRAVRMGKLRQTAQVVLLVTSAVAILVTVGLGNIGPIDFIGIILAGLAGLLQILPGKDKAEKKRRKKIFEDARYSWHLWEKKWKTEAGDTEFLARLKALTAAKEKYETIAREYKNAVAALQHTSRDRQLKKFLKNCLIDSSSLPWLSENQKAALRSRGIESAADVVYQKITNLPGFDAALTNNLIKWSKQQEDKFVFDENSRVSVSDIQGLIHTFQPKIRPVEHEILSGVEKLYSTQQKILVNRTKFQPVIEKSAKDLAQAYANFSVFNLTGKLF